MFSSGIAGSGLHDASVRFRMYAIVFMGIFAFGSVLYWRAQLLVSSEYVDLPDHGQTLKHMKRATSGGAISAYKQVNETE